VNDAGERAELLRQIRRIELRTAAQADGSCLGPRRSPFKGSGMALANLREYLPGDDARAIDWKASARMDRLVVREFEEERSGAGPTTSSWTGRAPQRSGLRPARIAGYSRWPPA